jgi:hypothetical protein
MTVAQAVRDAAAAEEGMAEMAKVDRSDERYLPAED